MQRFLIQCANFALLALLLIGVPAVAHAQLGDWQISPASTLHKLVFGGLLLAVAGNITAGTMLIKSRKERILCWEWALVFGGLLAVQFAFTRGYFNFEWLKHALQWVQKRF
jgi:hypothetical protein